MVGPVLHRLTSLPVADDAVFVAGQRFYDQLDGVRRILADPVVTSARLVVNPERMVIAEARRTYTYLSLFGYQVDAVVVNRVLPDVAADPWFDDWRRAQTRAPGDDRGRASPRCRCCMAEHVGGEVVGLDALADFAQELWAGCRPGRRLVDDQPAADRARGRTTWCCRSSCPSPSGTRSI